jgi:hypothetical protein
MWRIWIVHTERAREKGEGRDRLECTCLHAYTARVNVNERRRHENRATRPEQIAEGGEVKCLSRVSVLRISGKRGEYS